MPAHPRFLRRARARVVWAVLALVPAACRSDEVDVGPPPPLAPELGVDPDQMEESDSGLRVRVLSPGQGEPAPDSARILVTYTGWLPDGTQFDSNEGRDPLIVTLGKDFLIDGFMEGLEGIRRGEERQLLVPPELAYGAAGDPGVIPRNSWLVFRVRRVDADPPG